MVNASDVNVVKSVFDVAEKIHVILEKIPHTEVLNQEATINVTQSSIDYALAVKIPSNFRNYRDTIKFNHPKIIRASVTALSPFPQSIKGAMKKTQSDEGYYLFPELLPNSCDIISLNFTYLVDNAELIDDLVDTASSHDPGGPDKNEYWLHAQLKHPNILVKKFGRFDVRDVDVTVGVDVLKELNTTIPNPFINRLKTIFEVLNEKDPRQQWKAIPKLRTLSQSSYAGKEFDILKELESLFLPNTFSKFIDIKKDFRYSTCNRGSEAYELPIDIIPKKMEIISRSDLTLEKPAAEGILVYKETLFRDSLLSLFE